MRNIIITIDGPAASGKEKIAKFISRKWKFKHLDSGLLYRRLALILLNDKINVSVVIGNRHVPEVLIGMGSDPNPISHTLLDLTRRQVANSRKNIMTY